ncbi:hypothetical protein NA57DRAFT_51486 [Rhizodiscina lignyota]|uniref:Uncharacterized protein n=1 Tax=Rhizodiscina lignyota TaxID=1504668 RepID=A0A9P4IRE2_9PEZI|nr:hypothetical protein NA57DRAFT_51486 [Rhizodiscina lignyota]
MFPVRKLRPRSLIDCDQAQLPRIQLNNDRNYRDAEIYSRELKQYSVAMRLDGASFSEVPYGFRESVESNDTSGGTSTWTKPPSSTTLAVSRHPTSTAEPLGSAGPATIPRVPIASFQRIPAVHTTGSALVALIDVMDPGRAVTEGYIEPIPFPGSGYESCQGSDIRNDESRCQILSTDSTDIFTDMIAWEYAGQVLRMPEQERQHSY